jgi:DNA-directed RNA polymerase specialized sigma24 family protein
LAEDLTQEALLRLLRGQQRGQPLTRAYLHRVCQSVLYDHLRQCAREFYKDAAHKSGAQRRELDITPCFAALLRWIVRLWTLPHKCLALALDATTLKQRFTVLSISVLYQHRAIPVA